MAARRVHPGREPTPLRFHFLTKKRPLFPGFHRALLCVICLLRRVCCDLLFVRSSFFVAGMKTAFLLKVSFNAFAIEGDN